MDFMMFLSCRESHTFLITLHIQYRVQPYPDPDSPETTKWMTQQEVYEEALKPSKKWVEAGNGEIGRVYVEVIACDDLPNLVSHGE